MPCGGQLKEVKEEQLLECISRFDRGVDSNAFKIGLEMTRTSRADRITRFLR